MKLIKISNQHYVIVDDSEIKEGDYDFCKNYRTITHVDKERLEMHMMPVAKGLYSKVTHSTQPLVHPNCCIAKEGITNMNKGCSERNRCLSVPIIPLSEVEELVDGYSAYNYKAEEQIRRIKESEEYVSDLMMQSLLPKTSWDIKFDEQGKLKLI